MTTQTRPILRMAQKIKKMREMSPPKKWREICQIFGISKRDGSPDTGLAYLIAYDGFQPTKDVLKRMGIIKQKTKTYAHWRDLQDNEISWLFENREVMK